MNDDGENEDGAFASYMKGLFMDCFLIIVSAIIALAIIIGVVIYSRKKARSGDTSSIEQTDSIPSTALVTAEEVQNNEITIPIELLPATTQIEEKSLFEITDSTVIARISQTLPAVAETATRTAASKALKSMEVYKAILPSGKKLVKSKDMAGAVRGFFRGAKGIKSQANLVKVDVSKTTAVANGMANVINVGSLVVGQYYMSEISSKLEDMTKSIDKISDFQDREFKSRILSVITLVGEISQFSSEIMEDDDQRTLKHSALENLKATATELLGQVNITISDITKKTPNPDYKDYQSKVDDFKMLVGYQNVLVAVLEEISKLTYLLGKGSISAERSYASYNKYLEQSVQTRTLLGQWHDRQVKTLRIDLDNERISKAGFEAVISAIPGLIDDKFNYKELKQSLAHEISTQANPTLGSSEAPNQVYNEDVAIIIKDGKYYYLPEASDTKD